MTAPALVDQTVLITGAAVGLGRALARAFDRAGARLVLTDVDAGKLAETAGMLSRQADMRAADLADRTATLEFIAWAKATCPVPDTLIHNAGYLLPTLYDETDQDHWDRTFNVGISAAHLLTKAWWHDWQSRGAAVIHVSSRSGIEGGARHVAYTATKHAIEGFVKSLGMEGTEKGIFIHAVTPGMYMHTPMSEQNYTAELKEKWVEPIALTPAFLHLARRSDAELSGQRLSAWDLSLAHPAAETID